MARRGLIAAVAVLTLTACLAAAGGCGRKGNPVAPEDEPVKKHPQSLGK